MGDSPDDKKHVRLPGRESCHSDTEAVEIPMSAGRRHVLHPATCGDERIVEKGEFPPPTHHIVEFRSEKATLVLALFGVVFSGLYPSH